MGVIPHVQLIRHEPSLRKAIYAKRTLQQPALQRHAQPSVDTVLVPSINRQQIFAMCTGMKAMPDTIISKC